MLKTIYINNYALIDKLELNFDDGLNVITGETGAGKSIIIGALGLVLGNRADKNVLNEDANRKCIIEVVYNNISNKVSDLLSLFDFDIDSELRIRREITPLGKSRAFVNDTPASLQQLKEFAALLIDVNSQNQTYIFKKPEIQLSILDDLAGTELVVESYSQKYKEYKKWKKELASLTEKEKEAIKQQDFIQFQFDELDNAALNENEEAEIRSQLQLMDNAELIKQVLHISTQKLSLNEENVVSDMEMILSELQNLQSLAGKYDELYKRLNSSLIELQDIASEYEQLNENVDFEPEVHSQLQERLDLILYLQQKHNKRSIAELIEYKNELDAQLLDFGSLTQDIEAANKKMITTKKVVESAAAVLSKKRLRAIPSITNKIIASLKVLGMKDADFQISVTILDDFTSTGIDDIEFLFSSNKGHKAGAVSKVASGGELSRLVLALKSMLSDKRSLPTVIFDEIDTGVSGDIATKVGDLMQKMATNMQLITITHLPQIAAKGNSHFKVFKKEVDSITFSDITLLSAEQRKHEIALMLSGNSDSKSALNMAEELLS